MKKENGNDFYQRILKLCKQNKLTPAAFERNAGLAVSTMAHWANKCNPSLDNIKRVAAYFGVSIDYLVYGRKGVCVDEEE